MNHCSFPEQRENSATSVMLMELNAQFRVLTAPVWEIRQEFGQADKVSLLLTALNDTQRQSTSSALASFFRIIICGLIKSSPARWQLLQLSNKINIPTSDSIACFGGHEPPRALRALFIYANLVPDSAAGTKPVRQLSGAQERDNKHILCKQVICIHTNFLSLSRANITDYAVLFG